MSFSVPLVNSKTLFQTHTIVRVTLVHEKNQMIIINNYDRLRIEL